MLRAPTNLFKPDYQAERERCKAFLAEFSRIDVPDDPVYGSRLYMQQLQQVANRNHEVVEVYLEDLETYFREPGEAKLLAGFSENTLRYQRLLLEAADELMPQPTVELLDTIQDIILKQREQLGTADRIPAEMKRRYELVLTHLPDTKSTVTPLRHVGSAHIGHLINIKGIVTRATSVKPKMRIACYVCDLCGYELYQTVSGDSYSPLVECQSEACKQQRVKGKLHSQTRGSRFTACQEIRIQETSDEVPMGNVPRILRVLAHGGATRQCVPGDFVTITGVFLPAPYIGFRGMKAGLIHDTYIEAFKVVRMKKSYKETSISQEMVERIQKERASTDVYSRLAQSIAPEIYGLQDVKKALLLLLVGGVQKETKDGMKIRGDINILLMGDPGVAKSQLLKHISLVAPRAVYTTGKGSSGVGLTAAVLKDPSTGELVLEGGALVLADMGICCIDEFDKMEERDRTAIHEVMEQQTVSIAKAGITTTLNARTSVLAAANPIYGRYNRKLTPHQNINLPAALLSRFDLIFLLLDTPDEALDNLLAAHVTYVHRMLVPPKLDFTPFDAPFLRAYIAEAKRINPVIPKSLMPFIVQQYVDERAQQTDLSKAGFVYVTPRTLLGVIRLAQGLARLRFAEAVTQQDVEEALRLMKESRNSVNEKDGAVLRRVDPVSAIFQIVLEECQKFPNKTISKDHLERRVIAKGIPVDRINETLETYEQLNVLHLSEHRNQITLTT
jgi:DNA replication licensing factor MCM7